MKKLIISVFLYFIAMSLFAPNLIIKTDSYSTKSGLSNKPLHALSKNVTLENIDSSKYLVNMEKKNQNISDSQTYKIDYNSYFVINEATHNSKQEFTNEDFIRSYILNDTKTPNPNSTRLVELN